MTLRNGLIVWMFCLLPALAMARGGDSLPPILNEVKDPHFAVDPLTVCKIDTLTVPFDSLIDQLNRDPGPHIFRIRFGVKNTGDRALDLSIYAGDLNYIDLYILKQDSVVGEVKAGNLRPPPENSNYAQQRSGLLPMHLPAHFEGMVDIAIRQRTDEYDLSGLDIVDEAGLNAVMVRISANRAHYLIFQLLFQGLLICQLLYVLFQWLIIRKREYLYYFFYLLVTGLYFLSKQEGLFGVDLLFTRWPLLRIYFGKTLLILPYFLYFRFVRSFLEMPVNFPALNKWVIRVEYFLLGYMVFDLGLIGLSFNRRLQTELYTFALLFIFVVATSFMIYLYRRRQVLVNYIITGSLFVATGNIVGLVISYLEYDRHIDLGVSDVLVFAQIGIVLEIICLTAGLSYKSQAAEKEKVRSQEKLIEQLQANELLQNRMQTIRNKIAQDLHDDIGSTLSSISILSGLALEGKDSGQALETMSEIKDSSLMLMERMDDIVWSINPRNDSLENLLIRVKHFATTLFEAKDVEYSIDIQENIHEVKLPSDNRQHIYLVLKEAINNLVKYSGATRAEIRISFSGPAAPGRPQVLELSVSDNGRGFDADGLSRGNGIPGMRRRAELMNAALTVRSGAGKGTHITLKVNIL